MSRALRKAVEVVKHRKDTELNLPDEGVANLEDVPELCELISTVSTSLAQKFVPLICCCWL